MTCTLPRIGRETVVDRMASRALAERIPLTASLEIIATCNFKCQHCYIAPCAEREDVLSVADRIAFIYQGRIHALGTPEEFRSSADPVVRQFISGSAHGPIAGA